MPCVKRFLLVLMLLMPWKAHAQGYREAMDALEAWDYEKAFQILLPLAEQSRAGPAQFELARLYQNGTGVEPDLEKAVYWFRRSAMSPYLPAWVEMGFAYQVGLGVPQSDALAAHWMRLAADQSNEIAELALSRMIRDGRAPGDLQEAFELCIEAAEQDYGLAQWQAGLMYRDAIGNLGDSAQALKWLLLAARHRDWNIAEQIALSADLRLAQAAVDPADRVLVEKEARCWQSINIPPRRRLHLAECGD